MELYGTYRVVTEVVSEEVKKRLGLYSIVNAEVNFTPEAFDRLVFNSYRINDELGYFVDFSIVENELRAAHGKKKCFTRLNDGIMEPDWEYEFSGEAFGSTVISYGTLYSLGTRFEYEGLWSDNSKKYDIPLETETGNLPVVTQKDVFDAHNSGLCSTGAPAIKIGRNGQIQFVDTYDRSFTTGGDRNLASGANALNIVTQYYLGAQNAMENANSIQMPSWEINDMHFFTAIGKYTKVMEMANGYTMIVTGPDFYSSTETLIDRRIRNYSNYLKMDPGWKKTWKSFLGWLTGWGY